MRKLSLFVISALLRAAGPPHGINVAPDTIYLDKVGSETTLSRTVQITRKGPPGTPITFTAAASTSSGGSWLSVTPTSGTVPRDLTITGTPGSLAAGVYNGKVTVTPSGDEPEVVSVVLRVLAAPGGSPSIVVRPDHLNFSMVQGGSHPDSRTVNISSPTGGSTFQWTATKTVTTPTGGTWLQIAPSSGKGPGSITVSINGAGLSAGHFTGLIRFASGAATDEVEVSLDVRGATAPKLVIDPRAFNFIVLPGRPAPAPKTLRVKNAGTGTLSFTAAATSSGWLSITPASGIAPADITLKVNPAGLARGMYEGSVKVTAAGKTETARVFLRIVGAPSSGPTDSPSAQSAVQISPGAVEFNAPVGGPATPATVSLQLTSKVAGLTFSDTTNTATGGNWLNVTTGSGSIPGTLGVSVNVTGLAAGVYSGLINFSVQGSVAEHHLVAVTLRVGMPAVTPKLTLQPGAVVFQAVRGGANPTSAQVALGASGAASIAFSSTASTVSGGNWLSASPATGSAPTTITVNAANLASLAAGTYSGVVVFQATAAPGALPATLNVTLVVRAAASAAAGSEGASASSIPAAGVFVEPAADFVALADAPQSIGIMLFSSDGMPVEGADVQVYSSGGEPPFALEDAGSGLYTGRFRSLSGGTVSLNAVASAGDSSISFTLGGDISGSSSPRPVILQGGIVNAANFSPAPAPVVPGSILTLFGRGLADTAVSAQGFPLPRVLGGVKVLVAGFEAPLIALVPDLDQGFDQIVFQAPVELRGLVYADVVVLKDGIFSAPEGIGIADALPAVFTLNAQGIGAAAALHANYAVITAGNPARPGETVLLFATGLGEVQPLQASGEAARGNSRVVGDVKVTIGGLIARTDFAGLAPGFAGLYQLDVVVPIGLSRGDAALAVVAGGISSGEDVVLPVSP